MIPRVENDQGINPSELKLSIRETNKQAFLLMTAFREKLNNLDQFRSAATEVYLNLDITDGRSENVDKPRREVSFTLENSDYTVNYSFSAREQKLLIVKHTFHRDEDVGEKDPSVKKTELGRQIIFLKSRRFEKQMPIGEAEISWSRPSGVAVIGEPSPQTKTQLAVQKAGEILAGLSPQAPQK